MKNRGSAVITTIGSTLVGAAWLVGEPIDGRVEKYGASSLGRLTRMVQAGCDRVFDCGVAMIAADTPRVIAARYVARRQVSRRVT